MNDPTLQIGDTVRRPHIPKFNNGWISVKDRLPKEDNWILYAVLVDDDKLYRHQIAYYSKSKKWYRENEQHRSLKVTHWFPLPGLPL